MIYFEKGSPDTVLSDLDLKAGLFEALELLGHRKKVVAIPPDITRYYSKAGLLTEQAWEYFGPRLTDILPALGTHAAMSPEEISRMFGSVPRELFKVHDWRKDILTLGEVPSSFLEEV